MVLSDVKLNTICVIKNINITDEKTKLRLMELGLSIGAKVLVKHKSILKNTLLLFFNSSCFTLKKNLAELIGVEYA